MGALYEHWLNTKKVHNECEARTYYPTCIAFFLLYSAITVTNGFLQKPEMRCLKSLIILDGFNKFHSFPYIYKLNFLSVRFLQTNAGTVTHSANATWTRKENLKREK